MSQGWLFLIVKVILRKFDLSDRNPAKITFSVGLLVFFHQNASQGGSPSPSTWTPTAIVANFGRPKCDSYLPPKIDYNSPTFVKKATMV